MDDTPFLLDDVWNEIFQYLPLRDRKNIRLTCSRFYKVCNSVTFLKNEIINCDGNWNGVQVIRVLSKSCRILWNLNLTNIALNDEAVVSFFNDHGGKVQSLSLVHCTFAAGNFENIMRRCENLSTFYLYLDCRKECLFDDLLRLESQSFFINSVISLKIHIFQYWRGFSGNKHLLITNREFVRLFTRFPAVKQLEIYYYETINSHRINTDFDNVMSDINFTWTGIYNCIAAFNGSYEYLKLMENFDGSEISNKILINLKDPGSLKELSLGQSDGGSCELPFDFNLLQRCKQLTCLDLQKCSDDFEEKDLMCILKNVPKLLHLVMPYYASIKFDEQLFEKLVSSKLKTLDLGESKLSMETPLANEENLFLNYTLSNLTYNMDLNAVSLHRFLGRFKSLEHLSISFPIRCNSDLQTIMSLQPFLRTLKLLLPSATKDVCFQINLERLEYLNIETYDSEDLDEFDRPTNFPIKLALLKLKFLKVNLFEPMSKEHIRTFLHEIQHSSQLEAVTFTLRKKHISSKSYFKMWLQFCQNLQRLQFLSISDVIDEEPWRPLQFSDSEYRTLFKKCPSLRWVEHKNPCLDMYRSHNVYFRDLISGIIMHKSGECEPMRPRAKIGSFTDKM